MGRWDGAGGASHSGCVGSVGGMGKGGSRAKLGVSESKSEKLIQRSWGFERPHEDLVCRWAKGPAIESLCQGLICFTLCHALFLCLPPRPPPLGQGQ